MPIISTPQGFNEEELYVDLEPTFGHSVFLKCEGFNFARVDQAEGRNRDGGGGRTGRNSQARIGLGRVLVRESGCCVEHDRGEQGLRIRVCHGLPLQPVNQAVDAGIRQPSSRHHRGSIRSAVCSAHGSTMSVRYVLPTTATCG